MERSVPSTSLGHSEALKPMKRMVILPGYNVARTLGRALAELPPDCCDELLLVDDGSRDGTPDVARSLGVPHVAHGTNRGYGAAQKTGLRIALARHADVVVLLHADAQYDARCIPAMLRLVADGEADAVIGSRRLGGRCLEGGMPRWKLWANIALTAWMNACLGSRLSDPHSGLRVYSRRYLESVGFAAYADGFLFDSQMLFDGIAQGLRVVEIGIPTRYFPDASQMSAWTGLGYAAGIFAISCQHMARRGKRARRVPAIGAKGALNRGGEASCTNG